MAVVPHGPYNHVVDPPPRRRPPRARRRFLYFGIIRPYKGVEDLVGRVRPAAAGGPRHSRLRIVGETWEGWTAPLDAVAASPVRDRIDVVNRYVDDAEVADPLRAADAVVLPYRRSSSSGPLHIAMSAGLPVVVAASAAWSRRPATTTALCFVPPRDPACARRRARRAARPPR